MRPGRTAGWAFIGGVLLAGGACGSEVIAPGQQSGGVGGGGTTVTTGSGGDTTVTTGSGGDTTVTAGSGGDPGTGGAGGALDDITGTLRFTHVTEQGNTVSVPQNGDLDLSALVMEGGVLTPHPAVIEADGSFHIAGVPHVTYSLAIKPKTGGPTYLITASRTLDLDSLDPGRPDLVLATMDTPIFLDADGMSPWSAPDLMSFFSLDGATSGGFGTVSIAAGATSVSDLKLYDIDGYPYVHLVQGSKGDIAHALRWSYHEVPGLLGYRTITDHLASTSLELSDGQPGSLTGTFQPVPQDRSFSLSWKNALFAAVAPDVNPSAKLSVHGASVTISAHPGVGGAMLRGRSAPKIVSLPVGIWGDIDLDVAYGNPFPAGWDETVDVSVSFDVPAAWPVPLLPGTTSGQGSLSFSIKTSDLAAGPLVPPITPPLQVTINGQSAAAGLSGVGLSPLIAWMPPSTGTPSRYVVLLLEVDPMGGYTFVASMVTAGTSATLPPDLLKPGTTYVIQVVANTGSSVEAPFKIAPTSGSATAVTGIFTP